MKLTAPVPSQLVGVNAQSVQQVSTAFLGLLEAAGQAAGEVAGVLGAPRTSGSAGLPSAAADAEHHRMQRRRVLRWGIGLVVLLGGYNALRGVAGSTGGHHTAAARRLTWLQRILHLIVLVASSGLGYAVGPRQLMAAATFAYRSLKAIARGEDPLAPPLIQDQNEITTSAPSSCAPAEGGVEAVEGGGGATPAHCSSPLRRAVMSPADAQAILRQAIDDQSDSDSDIDGGLGGVEGGPVVVEASPMVSSQGGVVSPTQPDAAAQTEQGDGRPGAQRALDF